MDPLQATKLRQQVNTLKDELYIANIGLEQERQRGEPERIPAMKDEFHDGVQQQQQLQQQQQGYPQQMQQQQSWQKPSEFDGIHGISTPDRPAPQMGMDSSSMQHSNHEDRAFDRRQFGRTPLADQYSPASHKAFASSLAEQESVSVQETDEEDTAKGAQAALQDVNQLMKKSTVSSVAKASQFTKADSPKKKTTA